MNSWKEGENSWNRLKTRKILEKVGENLERFRKKWQNSLVVGSRFLTFFEVSQNHRRRIWKLRSGRIISTFTVGEFDWYSGITFSSKKTSPFGWFCSAFPIQLPALFVVLGLFLTRTSIEMSITRFQQSGYASTVFVRCVFFVYRRPRCHHMHVRCVCVCVYFTRLDDAPLVLPSIQLSLLPHRGPSIRTCCFRQHCRCLCRWLRLPYSCCTNTNNKRLKWRWKIFFLSHFNGRLACTCVSASIWVYWCGIP